MADLYCVHCGEPWDAYEFHDIAKQWGVEYRDVYLKFRVHGCGVFDAAWGDEPESIDAVVRCKTPEDEACESKTFRSGAAAVMELLGDDVDGAISTIEDFRYMGVME